METIIALARSGYVVTVIYLIFIRLYLGYMPSSISVTYYKLNEKKKELGNLFALFSMSLGFLIVPAMMEFTPDPWKVICLVAIFGLIGVGVAPRFLEDQRKEHYAFAALCIGGSQLWVLLISRLWYVSLPCFVVFALIAMRDRKWMTWMEVAALLSSFISLEILFGKM